ncbi:TPA: hypothetical protein ACNV4H_004350 [Citrobacter freundii]|nr:MULTISPECIES: hypothetical protein [Enterobacteriaceae]WQJ84852.1 hypothetical protein U4W25_03520 [Citrobacter amalonaticus]CZY22600.1 Uncharacterised protein [Enterobacter cloacae]CZZ88183.1 Uncharacterised protein [Enterobacter hormaechei]EUL90272.1 hypothetical protein P827_00206 [Enterobacter kobei]KDF12253.1 hypothetical protein AF41_00506 [Citrobacter sp. MGH 55]
MIIVETGNKFVTVESIVVQCGTELDKVIDLWCDDKLPLYVHFEGCLCQLSCTIHNVDDSALKTNDDYIYTGISTPNSLMDNIEQYGGFIEDRKNEIINELDSYQKNKSNLTNVRQFRRKKGAEICYIPIGDDQLYYDGYAYGYWQVKPGATTKFVKSDYKVFNANPFFSDDDNSSFLKVIGHDENDFLTFKEVIEVSINNLYMNVDDIEKLACILTVSPSLEKVESGSRYSKIEHLALYILLNEYCLDNEGNVNFTTMADILTSLNKNKYGGKYKFNSETVRRWLKNVSI